MSKQLKNLKVAIVSDHCFSFGGAARTTKCIGEIFKNVDYYFLMGNSDSAKEYFHTERIYFSSLNRLPFLKDITDIHTFFGLYILNLLIFLNMT